jgi:hypothetical protein
MSTKEVLKAKVTWAGAMQIPGEDSASHKTSMEALAEPVSVLYLLKSCFQRWADTSVLTCAI